jgi:hypothetical protein
MTMWGTLVPVLIGGLLTLAGGFFGPLFLQERKDKAEKKKHRSEKFEELVTAVYEFDTWLDNLESIRAHGKVAEIGISPFAKLEAISAVHFPMFMKKIEELSMAAKHYQEWMATTGYNRVSGQGLITNDGLIEVYNPYLDGRNGLLDELRKYAVENFR